jgi:hypothetical protein
MIHGERTTNGVITMTKPRILNVSGVLGRQTTETLLLIRDQESALLGDSVYEVDHPAIRDTIKRIDSILRSRGVNPLAGPVERPWQPGDALWRLSIKLLRREGRVGIDMMTLADTDSAVKQLLAEHGGTIENIVITMK